MIEEGLPWRDTLEFSLGDVYVCLLDGGAMKLIILERQDSAL